MRRRKFIIATSATLATELVLSPFFALANAFNIPLDTVNEASTLSANDDAKFLTPDENGVSVREGFRCRLIAQSNQLVANTGHTWHNAPDGGAVIPKIGGGGYYYVSNSEARVKGEGGVSSIEFNQQGELVDAYPILTGTFWNCAGGVSPEGYWLSCEENENGWVWKTDPSGKEQAVRLDSLGQFFHEAAAVDPSTGIVYMTEDSKNGLFYRWVPDVKGQYTNGKLQAAYFWDRYPLQDGEPSSAPRGKAEWLDVPDPQRTGPLPTRVQKYNRAGKNAFVEPTIFRGGEGAVFDPAQNKLFFSTKWDNRIWAYDVRCENIELYWQGRNPDDPNQVDNLALSPSKHVVIAEDNGANPFLRLSVYNGYKTFDVVRVHHQGSELTGPNFAHVNGQYRLYFSSQRGPKQAGMSDDSYLKGHNGMTFEVSGPFLEHGL